MKQLLGGILLLGLAFSYGCGTKPPAAGPPPVIIQAGPAPETVSVVVYREIADDKQESVPAETVFTSGQAVRLGISTAESGYLTLLMKGSSGKTLQLFPDKAINNGQSEVAAHRELMIPTLDRVFRFDKTAGVETIYIVYSQTQSEPLRHEMPPASPDEHAAYLDKLAQENNSDAVTTQKGSLVRVVRLQHK